MRKVEYISNEMIDQIGDLIKKSFPPMLEYKVEYYTGEEEDTYNRLLVFDLTSKAFGSIYRKAIRMQEGRVAEEYERDFIGSILSDFILLGTTFITNNIMAKKASERKDADSVLKYPYSKGRLNNVNLN